VNRRVTSADAQSIRFCLLGVRDWLVERGHDWRTFIKEGLPIEVFEEDGDPRATRLAAAARERWETEDG